MVIDETGEPVCGMWVRLLHRVLVSGRARLAETVRTIAVTDDRGMFRASGLPPGQYAFAVSSIQATLPAADVQDYFDAGGASSRLGQFSSVSASLARPGSEQNQQFGDHLLQTLFGMPMPIIVSDTGRLSVYPTTYFPGVTSITEAAMITLAAGEDRAGFTMQMRPVPSVRVSGRILGPSGPLGRRAVRLIAPTAAELLAPSPFRDIATALSNAAGEFTFLGIPAGSFTVTAMSPPDLAAGTTAPKDMLWAAQALVVGAADLNDVVVTMRPTIPVSGRIVLVPAPGTQVGTAKGPPSLDMNSVSFTTGMGPAESVRPSANGEFTTGLPAGTYSVWTQPPPGWFIRSVTANNRPIGEGTFELGLDGAEILITCTNAPSRVRVSAPEARDAPAGSVRAFLFPADRSAWTGYGPRTRRIQMSRTDFEGGVLFEGMTAGDYLIAAARSRPRGTLPDRHLAGRR
jgi:hypothetical protein